MPSKKNEKNKNQKRNSETQNNDTTAKPSRKYVIQRHDASKLHFDLRLEIDGVLKSWAIPKEPPTEKGIKRLAIETEDHPVDYAEFEGRIPEGQYGAGEVEIWDSGTFQLEKREEEKIVGKIHGEKLNGKYCLIKFSDEEKNWLFFKC